MPKQNREDFEANSRWPAVKSTAGDVNMTSGRSEEHVSLSGWGSLSRHRFRRSTRAIETDQTPTRQVGAPCNVRLNRKPASHKRELRGFTHVVAQNEQTLHAWGTDSSRTLFEVALFPNHSPACGRVGSNGPGEGGLSPSLRPKTTAAQRCSSSDSHRGESEMDQHWAWSNCALHRTSATSKWTLRVTM